MIKTISQQIIISQGILDLMTKFRNMVNDCIRIGLQNSVTSLKALSIKSYHYLDRYDIVSYYKLHAISRASGILQNRKKSIKRGFKAKTPYLKMGMIISCYGFKIDYENGILKIPLGHSNYFDIKLNNFVLKTISTLKVHSFSISSLGKVSLSYSKPITKQIGCSSIVGLDRNLNNVTVGSIEKTTRYGLEKCNEIIDNTKSIYKSFKRNDHRIRKKIYSKYGNRRRNRINQILHKTSKNIVNELKENKQGIAFEKLTFIRRLYQKGNGQGNNYRGKMNAWSFAEIKRQIKYKAEWEGIKVIELSSKDTRYTSSLCHKCGKRTQYDKLTRLMSCDDCHLVIDRDVLAAINIAKKGDDVFHRSKCLSN
jgi:putative transposase